MSVCVNVTDALARPKSEILGTYVSVNKIFALVERGLRGKKQKRKENFPNSTVNRFYDRLIILQ